MKRLAIATTHPIQYNAPFFKLLAESKKIKIKVFYTWGQTVLSSKYDPGFNRQIEWDIPLLDGYEYEFLENVAKDKGSHHFWGIINPDIIDRIKEFKPDTVLVYGWKFYSHLKVLRYFKGKVPVWFRGDSTLLDETDGIRGVFKYMLLKWVYKHIDKAFVTGANNRNYFSKYGLREDQLVTAYHAIENERFCNTGGRFTVSARELKKKLNIHADSIVFLYAGKLQVKKGVVTLVKAFSVLKGISVDLVIVGNGLEEEKLKQLALEMSNVHFIEFQNQDVMPIIYQLCDVFVLPSTGPGESWGLSLNEAMAAGKVVIASDRCGAAIDLVKDGENGYIFEAGNELDLLNKMQMIIRIKSLESMRLNSKRIIKDFTFSGFATAIENLIGSGNA